MSGPLSMSVKTVIFRSRNRARCQELWAVLDAARVPAEVVDRYGGCVLVVPDEHLERAVEELDDYRRELREELGGVYGVSVSASSWTLPEPGYRLGVGFQCDPERVDELEAARKFAVAIIRVPSGNEAIIGCANIS